MTSNTRTSAPTAFHTASPLRWVRHLWLDADDARRTLTPQGLARLEARVRESETRHRGELRLCVEGGLPAGALWDGLDAHSRAIDLFGRLRVWDTEHNNGVLIYLLLADHRIEILADRGLASQTPPDTWQRLTEALADSLREGRFEEGLANAIDQVGALMRERYPLQPGEHDRNELPDAVVLL
jgi:uncharacterized membrane protein YgcG